MYQIDFQHPIHIYCIGIGGISMSGLAEILLDEGFRVSGSDIRPYAFYFIPAGNGRCRADTRPLAMGRAIGGCRGAYLSICTY